MVISKKLKYEIIILRFNKILQEGTTAAFGELFAYFDKIKKEFKKFGDDIIIRMQNQNVICI